jgi:AcrR family transcriptional regulator
MFDSNSVRVSYTVCQQSEEAQVADGQRGFGPAFAAPSRGRPRPQLTRDGIVSAALAVLDAEGESALTYRRLASELGVGAASLYWHVPNREALLELALDAVAGEIWEALATHPDDLEPTAWRAGLERTALVLYDTLVRRPWAAEQQLVSQNRGLNQLRIWDRMGRILFGTGLGTPAVFDASTAVLNFVLGSTAQEAANARSSPIERNEYLEAMGEFLAGLDADQLPAVTRMATTFGSHDQRAQFVAGLACLLAGIEGLVGATSA